MTSASASSPPTSIAAVRFIGLGSPTIIHGSGSFYCPQLVFTLPSEHLYHLARTSVSATAYPHYCRYNSDTQITGHDNSYLDNDDSNHSSLVFRSFCYELVSSSSYNHFKFIADPRRCIFRVYRATHPYLVVKCTSQNLHSSPSCWMFEHWVYHATLCTIDTHNRIPLINTGTCSRIPRTQGYGRSRLPIGRHPSR